MAGSSAHSTTPPIKMWVNQNFLWVQIELVLLSAQRIWWTGGLGLKRAECSRTAVVAIKWRLLTEGKEDSKSLVIRLLTTLSKMEQLFSTYLSERSHPNKLAMDSSVSFLSILSWKNVETNRRTFLAFGTGLGYSAIWGSLL